MPDLQADDYVAVNRRNWESRVPLHVAAYGLDHYRTDPHHLSGVVTFDAPRLGDITGLETVHLQCHLGTDTLSLARLGARPVGLDFSPAALEVARQLAADCGTAIEFAEADVYDAVAMLGAGRFDLVYTGIGALCWVSDVRHWASVVGALLGPGGRLFIREGHPMLWALADPRPDGLLVLEYPYFETPDGTTFVESASYVDHDGEIASPTTIQWNHGLGEIITAVLDAGLDLVAFEEHTSVPWNPLHTAAVQLANGEYQLAQRPERLAVTYTLQAVKR